MTARHAGNDARNKLAGTIFGAVLVAVLAVSGLVPAALAFLGLIGLLLPGLRGREPIRQPVAIPVRDRR